MVKHVDGRSLGNSGASMEMTDELELSLCASQKSMQRHDCERSLSEVNKTAEMAWSRVSSSSAMPTQVKLSFPPQNVRTCRFFHRPKYTFH